MSIVGEHPSINHLKACQMLPQTCCVNNSLHTPASALPVVLTSIRQDDINVIKSFNAPSLPLTPPIFTHCIADKCSLRGLTITVLALPASHQLFCPKHAVKSLPEIYLLGLYS